MNPLLKRRLLVVLPLLVTGGLAAAQSRVDGWRIQVVSISDAGVTGNANPVEPIISGNGSFVGFSSLANNLVPNDTNGTWDGFVSDWANHHIERVTLSSTNQEANGSMVVVALSHDGRFAATAGAASNIIPEDDDTIGDGYLRDRWTGETRLVTPRFITGVPKLHAGPFGMSGDARYVVIMTDSADLLAGDTNGEQDIYVFDVERQAYHLASASKSGQIGNHASYDPTISSDGGFVAFRSAATNLVPGYGHVISGQWPFLKNLETGEIEAVHVRPDGTPIFTGVWGRPRVSTGGRYVAYEGWGVEFNHLSGPHGYSSVFVRDMNRTLAGNAGLGVAGNRGNHTFDVPAISANGRFVVMGTWATDVTPVTGPQRDAVVRDRELEILSMLNFGDHGQLPNENTGGRCAVSDDGRVVAFISNSSNLVPEDTTSGTWDVYVVSRDFAEPAHYCNTLTTATGCTIRIDSDSLDGPDRPSGPHLCLRDAPASSQALLFYSINGPDMLPFGTSGWLCIRAPYAKLLLQPSGSGATCGGEFDFDFAHWIDSGADPQLGPGKNVYLQAWVSDPSHAVHGTLTDALAFRIQP